MLFRSALRIPDDELTLAVLREVGPMAVSSANRSGEPTVTTITEAGFAFGPAVDVYLDAGVRRTANISQAVKAGAQLIIAYNPFRPFVNFHADQLLNGNTSISDMGIATVINQAFRTMLHTRLMLGIERLAVDPTFHGDIILLEPSETDTKFFNTNPMNFWQRAESALHGYVSATEAINPTAADITVPPSPNGTKIRINEFFPGHLDSRNLQSPIHRTESIDYGIVLEEIGRAHV
mgnify:CR=1 FL=1